MRLLPGQMRAAWGVFGVEAGEAFSFHGTQSIALLYLLHPIVSGGFGLTSSSAFGIVGACGGVLYLSTPVGGWLAKRVLGASGVIVGAGLLILGGYVVLIAWPSVVGACVALFFIASASGVLKANAADLLASIYAGEDDNRDNVFTVLYSMVNLGAFAGSVVAGVAQIMVGFRFGFVAAGLGMIIGLTNYLAMRSRLPARALHVPRPISRQERRGLVGVIALAGAVLFVLIAGRAIHASNLPGVVLVASAGAALVILSRMVWGRSAHADFQKRVVAYFPIFGVSVVFWALFQQQYTVITVYADVRLDRTVGGFVVPVAWIQALSPLFVILLAGGLTRFWRKMGDRQPSSWTKMAIGMVLIGGAFCLFIPFSNVPSGEVPFGLIIVVLLVFTVAEMLVAPVALSLSSQLAPSGRRTQMIALFFLSVALGSAISGELSELYRSSTELLYFMATGSAAIAAAAILALCRRWLK